MRCLTLSGIGSSRQTCRTPPCGAGRCFEEDLTYPCRGLHRSRDQARSPFSLVFRSLPVITVARRSDPGHEQTLANLEELHAREAFLVVITDDGDSDFSNIASALCLAAGLLGAICSRRIGRSDGGAGGGCDDGCGGRCSGDGVRLVNFQATSLVLSASQQGFLAPSAPRGSGRSDG
jgi:hypothetical protein